MSAALRVVLADDSADLRDVARFALEQAGLDVVGETGEGVQALSLAAELRPDAVVLDVSMAGPPIEELVAGIRALEAPPAVVVYTGWPAGELPALDARIVRKGPDPGALAQGVVEAVREESRR
jgi:DNA-binding NarL/FixJ family response regulator